MSTEAAIHPMVRLFDATDGSDVRCIPRRLVIAGFTARDAGGVQRHIDELAALGVPPPDSVPAFYEVPVELLEPNEQISVSSPETSGEAEPVLFCTGQGWYIGVGSDHTARDIERQSIATSKARCPKPFSSQVVRFAHVRDRWDRLVLRSHADGVLYQEATLEELLPIPAIVDSYRRTISADTGELVMFCGTVPTLSGEFYFSDIFRAELVDDDRPLLTCTYHIRQDL